MRCQLCDRGTAGGPPGPFVSSATSVSVRRAHSRWMQFPLAAPADEVWVLVCESPFHVSDTDQWIPLPTNRDQFAIAPNKSGASRTQELPPSPAVNTFTDYCYDDKVLFLEKPQSSEGLDLLMFPLRYLRYLLLWDSY